MSAEQKNRPENSSANDQDFFRTVEEIDLQTLLDTPTTRAAILTESGNHYILKGIPPHAIELYRRELRNEEKLAGVLVSNMGPTKGVLHVGDSIYFVTTPTDSENKTSVKGMNTSPIKEIRIISIL